MKRQNYSIGYCSCIAIAPYWPRVGLPIGPSLLAPVLICYWPLVAAATDTMPIISVLLSIVVICLSVVSQETKTGRL